MKAAYFETTGAPEVIRFGERPTPVPTGREVRVRVAAVAVNPIDTYLRAGAIKMPLPMPFTPGCDLAGTVEAVGPQARRFKVGDRVWGSNQGLLGRQGTFAEFSCADEEYLYPLPAGVKETDAAAAALVGITAHLGLFQRARLQAGETVFVNGGTGGVGSMVVQMARATGARAVATVGSAEKAAACRAMGAERAIHYKTEDVASVLKELTGGKGVDVWYETQREQDFVKAVDLIRPRGRMVIMAGREARPIFPTGPFYVKDLALHGFAMFNATPDEQRACSVDINRWMSEGKLKPTIGRTFPISETAAAHRLQEENTLGKAGTLSGKIVLTP